MTWKMALQKKSARTNLPQKLIRPGRGSELNGVKNNPRFAENFKGMNASLREITESDKNLVYLPGADGSSDKNVTAASELDTQISLFSSVREVESGGSITIRAL